jgi:hypothetical protein
MKLENGVGLGPSQFAEGEGAVAMTLDQLIAYWKERRLMLDVQRGRLSTGYPHDEIVSELMKQDVARLDDWIVVLDKLIAEHSKHSK